MINAKATRAIKAGHGGDCIRVLVCSIIWDQLVMEYL